MSWLIDSLLHPSDSTIFKSITESGQVNLADINARLQASNNVALHLLLSSASRGFLTTICRRLTNLDYTARKAMSTAAQNAGQGQPVQGMPALSSSLRAAYTSIATLTSTSIVQIRIFETFLTSISASIKDSYTTAGLVSASTQPQVQGLQNPERTRNMVEQAMLFGGPLPEALIPAMSHLFTSLLPTLRSNIDPSKLFFHDFSILALDPSGSETDKDSHTYGIDVFQRTAIVLDPARNNPKTDAAGSNGVNNPNGSAVGKKYRRCARCAAVMEDVTSRRPAVSFLIMQQRRCFCGGNWVVLTEKELSG